MFWSHPPFSCSISVYFDHSLCASPLTNTTSWRKKGSYCTKRHEFIKSLQSTAPNFLMSKATKIPDAKAALEKAWRTT